jgi:hypothetical protein
MTGGCAFNGALDVRFEEWVSNDHESTILATARDWDPEIQRRREAIGFSYVVVGADFADALAPVVAELAGR